MSKATTFSKLVNHLDSVCSVDLKKHLEFKQTSTIKDYALASSIMVLYRYAEKMGKKIEVRDGIARGHKSHIKLRTEVDFDLDGNGDKGKRDPLIQIRLVGDLLGIRDKIKKELAAFRLGFYFDYFDKAKNRAKTYEQFKTRYKNKESGASML